MVGPYHTEENHDLLEYPQRSKVPIGDVDGLTRSYSYSG